MRDNRINTRDYLQRICCPNQGGLAQGCSVNTYMVGIAKSFRTIQVIAKHKNNVREACFYEQRRVSSLPFENCRRGPHVVCVVVGRRGNALRVGHQPIDGTLHGGMAIPETYEGPFCPIANNNLLVVSAHAHALFCCVCLEVTNYY